MTLKIGITFLVSLFASVIGAICGIGGGIIIKPVTDAIGIFDVVTVSFLASCEVLAMSAYSVARNAVRKELSHHRQDIVLVSAGAVTGGLLGRFMLNYVVEVSESSYVIGLFQATLLALFLPGTILYTVVKSRIRTLQIKNPLVVVIIGLLLGSMSSFLGIGGGPINLMVLSFFFSMKTKEASFHSIIIIMFSQTANILLALAGGNAPEGKFLLIQGMIFCGILGGIIGRSVSRKIKAGSVDRLFIGLMGMMFLVNIYNSVNIYFTHVR